MLAGLFVVVSCALLNVAGIRVVGITSLAFLQPVRTVRGDCGDGADERGSVDDRPRGFRRDGPGIAGRRSVATWNYMGWDNASTIAQEVERPQRTYPRTMIAAVVLVRSFRRPVSGGVLSGIPASAFDAEGVWATVAGGRRKILGLSGAAF